MLTNLLRAATASVLAAVALAVPAAAESGQTYTGVLDGGPLSSGMSMGGGIAVMLAERHPDRFDGVLAQCTDLDYPGNWNTALDVSFVVRTLLASEDIDLALARDPAESTALLTRAAEAAQAWRPARAADPSWNTGVDYRRQLARSDYRDLAIGAYRDAGLNLRADLDALAEAPRIAADPAYLSRVSPTGRVADPVLTMHNSADGGAINGQDRWYAQQARPGLVRITAVDRGSHCAFNAAEEVTALHTLESHVDTCRWPTLNPRALNAAARADFLVRDLFTWETRAMPPAFTHPNPDRHLRPTR